MKHLHPIIAFFFILTIGSNATVYCQTMDYTLKAVALEKLSLFITWPKSAQLNDTSSLFVVTVLNNIPFCKKLEEVYKTHQINSKKVQVVSIKNIRDLKKCDVLFISKRSTSELRVLLAVLNGKPILTLSDTEGFADAGCLINFYKFDNKLRFEINQKGMKEAGFIVDYRLLKVSKVLNPIIK